MRNPLAIVAGSFFGLVVGTTVFYIVFIFPTWIWQPEIMLFAGWITTPLGLLAGGPAGVMAGAGMIRWLRGAGGLRNVALVALLIGVAVALHTFINGLYPRNFSIAWTEPVQLEDGSVVQVRRTRTLFRPGDALYKYKNAQFRSERLEAGPVVLETPLMPLHLNRHGGVWYAVVANSHHPAPPAFGNEINVQVQRLLQLRDGQWVGVPWTQAPPSIVVHNLIGEGVEPEELARFSQQAPTLATKRAIWQRYYRQQFPARDALRIPRKRGMDQRDAEYRQAIDAL